MNNIEIIGKVSSDKLENINLAESLIQNLEKWQDKKQN